MQYLFQYVPKARKERASSPPPSPSPRPKRGLPYAAKHTLVNPFYHLVPSIHHRTVPQDSLAHIASLPIHPPPIPARDATAPTIPRVIHLVSVTIPLAISFSSAASASPALNTVGPRKVVELKLVRRGSGRLAHRPRVCAVWSVSGRVCVAGKRIAAGGVIAKFGSGFHLTSAMAPARSMSLARAAEALQVRPTSRKLAVPAYEAWPREFK